MFGNRICPARICVAAMAAYNPADAAASDRVLEQIRGAGITISEKRNRGSWLQGEITRLESDVDQEGKNTENLRDELNKVYKEEIDTNEKKRIWAESIAIHQANIAAIDEDIAKLKENRIFSERTLRQRIVNRRCFSDGRNGLTPRKRARQG